MKYNFENYFDISSEYWQKVQRIYGESEHFPKKVVKDRNLHHKFPRSFSKKEGVEIDNDEDNLVSLSLSDHFLVHYYLWKCAKKGYRGMMALAFSFMRKKMIVYASEETIEQLAKDYETAMKEAAKTVSKARKGKKLSVETKKKMSEAKKGEKNPMYGKHFSEEHRERLSEARKGEKHHMYGKHHSEEVKKKMSKPKSDEAKKKMSIAKKNMTEYTKKKIAAANIGLHWYHNEVENIRAKECPPGCELGMLKRK